MTRTLKNYKNSLKTLEWKVDQQSFERTGFKKFRKRNHQAAIPICKISFILEHSLFNSHINGDSFLRKNTSSVLSLQIQTFFLSFFGRRLLYSTSHSWSAYNRFLVQTCFLFLPENERLLYNAQLTPKCAIFNAKVKMLLLTNIHLYLY